MRGQLVKIIDLRQQLLLIAKIHPTPLLIKGLDLEDLIIYKCENLIVKASEGIKEIDRYTNPFFLLINSQVCLVYQPVSPLSLLLLVMIELFVVVRSHLIGNVTQSFDLFP